MMKNMRRTFRVSSPFGGNHQGRGGGETRFYYDKKAYSYLYIFN
ncbi:MAG: hypothetical protein OT477_23215 [Chloroflexi bacterium]|nr:hypothetical protein [Chloroflexota bacterium]